MPTAVVVEVGQEVNNKKGRGPSETANANLKFANEQLDIAQAKGRRVSVTLDATDRYSTIQAAFNKAATDRNVSISFIPTTFRPYTKADGTIDEKDVAAFQFAVVAKRAPRKSKAVETAPVESPVTEGETVTV